MGALPNPIRQAAVIAVHAGHVCLVTSRGRKRWLFPKGCLEPDKTLREIALQEAWEEAGLVGMLQAEPVGSYLYEKAGNRYHVTVFLLQVTEIAAEWPEREWRKRRWLPPENALLCLQEPSLRKLFTRVVASRLVAAPA
jgi:8-oxo-dGTP pyrophosphatase MutT (NUDIX family)